MIRLALAALLLAGAAPVAIDLPADTSPYPDLGPGQPAADAVNSKCLGCQSAAMVLTQPKLTEAEWRGEIVKMRSVYKAPVPESDDAAIAAWLVAWSDAPHR